MRQTQYKWNNTNDCLPEIGQTVIVCVKNKIGIATYRYEWTWGGKKPKFVNALSSFGLWIEGVEYWTDLPKPPKRSKKTE